MFSSDLQAFVNKSLLACCSITGDDIAKASYDELSPKITRHFHSSKKLLHLIIIDEAGVNQIISDSRIAALSLPEAGSAEKVLILNPHKIMQTAKSNAKEG